MNKEKVLHRLGCMAHQVCDGDSGFSPEEIEGAKEDHAAIEYAIKAVNKNVNSDLEAKLAVAVEALEFYNQPKKYHGHESSKYGYVAGEIVNDNGDTAKEALEKIKAK
jgi:enolase